MEQGLWAAVITGAVAIVAGYLGTVWGGRSEHKRWLRNEKLKAFALANELLNEEHDLLMSGEKLSEDSDVRRSHAATTIFLLGSDKVLDRLVELIECEDQVADCPLNSDEWSKVLFRRDKAFLAMVNAMRRDIRSGYWSLKLHESDKQV